MSTPQIDLRSDTMTRPTSGMRTAMAAAEVGDDVFGEDPTVNKLEARVAEMLGKEAALFVPSGSMSNQVAIRAQTEPGDEILCDLNCHVYNYESGGPAALSGVTCRTVEGDYGVMELEQLEGLIRPENDHLVRTRMVCLENTHNRGGGKIYPLKKIEAITTWAKQKGLVTHLDGARLMNAVIATGIAPHTWTKNFDSVSTCFSKGLGAPVGSCLAGSRTMIKKARRIRKLFGGGMRQAGVLAAAALYALDHHVERLAEDHAHARILAEAIVEAPGFILGNDQVDTNIVYLLIPNDLGPASDVVKELKKHGVLALTTAPQSIRMCTHLDVSKAEAQRAATVIRQIARSFAPAYA